MAETYERRFPEITEEALEALRQRIDRPIGEIMGPALPLVGAGEPVDDVVAALAQSGAAIVVDAGQPIGVLTRSDVLDYLADRL